MIKLFKPYVSWRARWNVLKVLSGTQLAEGPMVKKFEYAFGKTFAIDPERCIAVNSGTSALDLAFELIGLRAGDEVITPVLTCTATNMPLAHRGVKITFCDITDKLLMDPEDVERRITRRTKAIVYVDFGGASQNIDQILEIAHRRKLPVVQDAAQSVGQFFNPKGDYVCVSFQAIKTLTTGDGGMLITPLSEAHIARNLRWFGIDRPRKQREGDVDVIFPGFKYHMNDISAAIGLGNLKTLKWAIGCRAAASRAYHESGLPILTYPWLAILIHPQALTIQQHLKGLGIESGQHHYRNDKYTVFGGRRTDLPKMDELEEQYLLLPYHQDMTPHKVKIVTNAIKDYLGWKKD